MNILLLFFALPIATILLAIVVQKILRCSVLTAITFFAIYLIVTFSIFDASFLVFAIVYTILAFLSAVIAEIFFQRCNLNRKSCTRWCFCNPTSNNTISLSNQDIARIANEIVNMQNNTENQSNCNCNGNCPRDVATVNVTNNTTGGRTNWCCYRR